MITLADIQAARKTIGDAVFLSPCAYSETFSRLTGNKIFFKLENLQMTGSFKERGAVNKLLSLTAEERQRLREKLVECGVVEAAAAQSVDGFAAFRKQAMLAPADTIAPARLEKLLIQELEFLAKLDQLAWTTWKMLAPKSALKRDTSLGDFRAVLRRYLKGDAEVNDLQLAQAIERTRQLVAILLGSIS